MRKTKIVATVGPATDNPTVMRNVLSAGLDVARFNFSHGTHEDHKMRLDSLRKICEEDGTLLAFLADTKGPEVRLGDFAEGKVKLVENSTFVLTTEAISGDASKVSVTYPGLPAELSPGNMVLLDDGLIALSVESISGNEITTRVLNGGYVSSKKGVNVPDVSLKLPFISEKDREDLKFIVENDFDILAASFVRSAEDIIELKNELAKHDPDNQIRIIAKIENSEGVDNVDEILQVTDGLMVARGDLGVEMPFEVLPIIQKQLINKALYYGKEVITATQMLESMIQNPRPTRAETSDVANAIFDGTGSVMLSAETSVGKYPAESVAAMARIAEEIEGSIDYNARSIKGFHIPETTITNAISHATVTAAHELNAKAILAVTLGGGTARNISKFRPICPIIACTPDPAAARGLKLDWGVYPQLIQEKDGAVGLFTYSVGMALQNNLLKMGDIAVMTAGLPLGYTGNTNMIKIHVVGEKILLY